MHFPERKLNPSSRKPLIQKIPYKTGSGGKKMVTERKEVLNGTDNVD